VEKLNGSGKVTEVFFDLIHDAIVIVDSKGRIVSANNRAAEKTGFVKEDLLQQKLQNIIAKERKSRSTERLSKIMRGINVTPFELEIITKRGMTLWMEVNGTKVEYKKKPAAVLVLRDVTKRRQIEDLLRESEQKYRAIVENLPDPIGILQEGILKYVNRAATEKLGWTFEEMTSSSFDPVEKLAPCEFRSQIKAIIARRLGGTAIPPYEVDLLTRDGSRITVVVHAERILYQKKLAEEIILIDITDRKRTETALRESEEKYRLVSENIPVAVYSALPDEYSTNTFTSGRIQELTGYSVEDYAKDPRLWSKILHQDDKEHVMEQMEEHVRNKTPFDIEYRIIAKDGSVKWLRDKASPVLSENGEVTRIDGFMEDVTERKKLEEELKKHTEHLKELVEERTRDLDDARRMATIGETAAMVGHDLRNPLQTIVNRLYLAKKATDSLSHPYSELADKLGLRGLIGELENQVNYMNKIVSDLQEYAKPLTPKLVETSPRHLIEETFSTIKTPENIEVSMDVLDVPRISVDPDSMRRVFTNLILNAFQAMPDGGKLTIRTSKRDEILFISFQDTGIGIPKENIDRIFSPLYTTKAKGVGLGLTVSERLVKAHNGRITVESELGKGSTFTIRLPVQSVQTK